MVTLSDTLTLKGHMCNDTSRVRPTLLLKARFMRGKMWVDGDYIAVGAILQCSRSHLPNHYQVVNINTFSRGAYTYTFLKVILIV